MGFDLESGRVLDSEKGKVTWGIRFVVERRSGGRDGAGHRWFCM